MNIKKIFLKMILLFALPAYCMDDLSNQAHEEGVANYEIYDQKESDGYNIRILQPLVSHLKTIAQERNTIPPSFIAITGCSAVGKTYFSQLLVRLLKEVGVSACILKGDDFFNPDYYNPNYYHPRLEYEVMHSVLQKIQAGQTVVKKPAWAKKKFWPPKKIEVDFSTQGIDLVFFEGEFTLCDDAPYDFSKYSRLGIFIDANDEDIIEWHWSRGRDIDNITKEEFRAGMQRYRSYIQSCPSRAAYHVTKDINHRLTVSFKPDVKL